LRATAGPDRTPVSNTVTAGCVIQAGAGGTEAKDTARERAREEARKRAEEESRKPVAERSRMPEFGSDKDFQLVQALNQLKGRPVLVSKTQVIERKDEKKDN
jgi:carboxyl-terminal processing protease